MPEFQHKPHALEDVALEKEGRILVDGNFNVRILKMSTRTMIVVSATINTSRLAFSLCPELCKGERQTICRSSWSRESNVKDICLVSLLYFIII